MKIVHVVYSLEMGGAESLVVQLCRLQRASGHEVSVCVYSRIGTLGEAIQAEGFRVHLLGEAPVSKTMLRCYKLFAQLSPDVVHCHNPAPTLQAALSARLAGVDAIISTRHSLVAPPYDTAQEIKFNLFSVFCDWVVGICDATSNNLRHTPLALKGRIVRVYNGTVRIEPAPPAQHPPKRGFTLLFVGRLAEVKDLPVLINAVALALPYVPGLNLWIVGDGPTRAELEDLVRRLGIAGQVSFWGERHDVARFFSSADVYAMSSVSEGLPMSLLQAMSIGLPTLVTDVGGMAEIVRNFDCGLYTPVGDPEAMSEAIIQLASNPEQLKIFSTRARDAYNAHFTLEQMNDAYMELYRGNPA